MCVCVCVVYSNYDWVPGSLVPRLSLGRREGLGIRLGSRYLQSIGLPIVVRQVVLYCWNVNPLCVCVFAEKVKVVKQPESRPISVGERLELVCEGSGVPRPEYLWFKADIHGNPYPMTGHKSSRLVLEEVKKEDSGRYCCRVMNKYHQDFTRWIEVVAKEPQGLNGQL